VIGKYRNYSGSSISLNADSTFNFKWHFSVIGNYANGIWTISNDTLYFKFIPKENRPKTLNGRSYLNLSVSSDKKRIVYTEEPIIIPDESDYNLPSKLYFKKEKLYEINEDGNIIKGHFMGHNPKKKYPIRYDKELNR